jgi:hypothetical protein
MWSEANMLYTINPNQVLDLMRRSIKRKYENIMMEGIEDRQFVKFLMELIEQNLGEEYTSETVVD